MAPYTRLRWWQVLLLCAPAALLIGVPLLALLVRVSPALVWAELGDAGVRQAIALSLRTSGAALGLSILVGLPAAYGLARAQGRLRAGLEALIDIPLVLPPSVAGLALLLAFGRRGLAGGLLESGGIVLPFSQGAVVVAQVFVASPYFIKSAAAGIAAVDRSLEEAAAIDGASAWRAAWHILLPLAWRALVAGALMAWARALGEFGATMIFAGNIPGRTQTMPLAIYLGFEISLASALALAAILLAFAVTILTLVRRLST